MAGPTDLFRLDGTTALVTGASAGLGLHFARVLHAAGARVALTARRADRIAAEAAALGPGACAVPLDVTDAAAIPPAFNAAEAALGGPVTLLVNNAGFGLTRRLAETTDADWDDTFTVNLRAAFLMCREAAGRMAAAGGGAIVNVASVLAFRVTPRGAADAASKAGLDHLTRVLAVELARDNIRVNALAPGYVETDMTRETLASDAGRAMLARIPQRRIGAPEDLTGPLLLLASRAGAHMTGATLVVDGGHSVGGILMDFALAPAAEALRERVRELVEDAVIPLEADPTVWDAHENIALDRLDALRARVKAAGLWLPQLAPGHGGLGVDHVTQAALYEEMNRGLFGPAAFNCAAPDDGTMMMLARIARPDQQARWLAPIASGAVRSAFAMTEPAPGAGSDPSMMRTTATRHGDAWRIEGRKWFITGAEVAGHFVLIARTSDDPRKGLTAFLFDRGQPGWRIERRIPIMGPEEHGGHCELVFDGLEIPDENRLLGVGDGLKVTQIRLGPARLTHCMRWLGLARRSLEIARAYVAERSGFGVRLADRESVQDKLGAAALAIRQGRLLVMHAAWKLDQGDRARPEISMAKVVVSEALHQAADTAIQLCGARGYSRDTPLEWIYRYARQARLVDGASEVHRMVLARELADRGAAFWRWDA